MIGATVPTRGGLHTGFSHAEDWKCECIQIYIAPSRTWRVPELTTKEISSFNEAQIRSSVSQVIAHIPFLVNLASPDQSLWHKSIDRLAIEISRASKLGVDSVVLHPGNHHQQSKKVGIERIAEAINRSSSSLGISNVKIYLETMAGQGTSMGSRLEELAEILVKVGSSTSLGICLDTAHLFEAGYDIKGFKGYSNFMEEFDSIIGIEKIGIIHINDSLTKLGSRCDRHAFVNEGEMGLEVFHAILNDSNFCNIPKIIEMPTAQSKVKDNLIFLRWLKQQPIGALYAKPT